MCIRDRIRDLKRKIDNDYMNCDYRSTVKGILEVGDIGNKYFQDNAPWELIKTDKSRCREVLTFTANIVKNLAIMLHPILPDFSDKLRKQLGIQSFFGWGDINFDLEEHQIGEPEIVLRKIEEIKLGPPKDGPDEGADPFSRLDLRVAKIEKVEQHPDAEKLYIEQIDVGGKKRQIVSGLKEHYKPKELEGKKIILVTNLKPAKLRGVESQGMLLAVESKDKKVGLLTSKDEPGEQVFIEGVKQKPAKEIDIKEFAEMKMLVSEGKVLYKGKIMKTKNGDLTVDRKIDGIVC